MSSMENITNDQVLLCQFVEKRDQQAYSALVNRYAAMVYGVCRRTLEENHAKVDEATQGVFLLLAQKAGSLRSHGDLNNWLYWTARNVARYLNRTERRRRRRENEMLNDASYGAGKQTAMNDTHSREILFREVDAALERINAPSREAVLLCHLQGLTAREAAARLGCGEEAVKKRSQRGLEQLRRLLGRKGLTLSVTALAAALRAEGAAAAATMPAGLIKTCEMLGGGLTGATGVGATTAASGKVITLAKAASKMMLMAKLKMAAAAVTVAFIVGVTVPTAIKIMRTQEPAHTNAQVESSDQTAGGHQTAGGQPVASEEVATPRYSPPGGTYVGPQNIAIPGSTPEAVVFSNVPLEHNVPITGIAGEFASEQFYVVTITATQIFNHVSTSNGVGDCDLYINYGSRPTTTNYTFASTRAGNNEIMLIGSKSRPGSWYIMLYGKSSYSNVILRSDVWPP